MTVLIMYQGDSNITESIVASYAIKSVCIIIADKNLQFSYSNTYFKRSIVRLFTESSLGALNSS